MSRVVAVDVVRAHLHHSIPAFFLQIAVSDVFASAVMSGAISIGQREGSQIRHADGSVLGALYSKIVICTSLSFASYRAGVGRLRRYEYM